MNYTYTKFGNEIPNFESIWINTCAWPSPMPWSHGPPPWHLHSRPNSSPSLGAHNLKQLTFCCPFMSSSILIGRNYHFIYLNLTLKWCQLQLGAASAIQIRMILKFEPQQGNDLSSFLWKFRRKILKILTMRACPNSSQPTLGFVEF
jgi:hypothetical protein